MTDIILMGCLLTAFYFNRDLLPAVVAYALVCLYSVTYFDGHSAVINHAIYGLIFIPACYFAKLRLSAGLLAYAVFNLIVALDWVFYPDADMTVVSYLYDYVQILLVFSLIYLSKGKGYNDRNNNGFITDLVNICDIQAFTKAVKRR